MILDIDGGWRERNVIPKPSADRSPSHPPAEKVQPLSLPTIPHSQQVIKRILHTRTEVIIYPDGKTFQKSNSWFEGETYIVKKKERPKAEVKKIKTNELEQY